MQKNTGYKPRQLSDKSNTRAIVLPRQIAMYLAKQLTKASLPEIGRAFGGKHQTTVLHAVNRIEQLRQSNIDINSQIHSLNKAHSSQGRAPRAAKRTLDGEDRSGIVRGEGKGILLLVTH